MRDWKKAMIATTLCVVLIVGYAVILNYIGIYARQRMEVRPLTFEVQDFICGSGLNPIAFAFFYIGFFASLPLMEKYSRAKKPSKG